MLKGKASVPDSYLHMHNMFLSRGIFSQSLCVYFYDSIFICITGNICMAMNRVGVFAEWFMMLLNFFFLFLLIHTGIEKWSHAGREIIKKYRYHFLNTKHLNPQKMQLYTYLWIEGKYIMGMHAWFLGQFIWKCLARGWKLSWCVGLRSKAILCRHDSLLARLGWQKGSEVL